MAATGMEATRSKEDVEKLEDLPVAPATRAPRTKEERSLIWRQDLRIIPLSSATYLLCFLDRANIGNARKLNSTTNNHMQYELGMTEYQFIITLLVFLVAYGLFEVPSNLLLKKLRPSRWIAFLMFTWGTFTMCLGACQDFNQLAAVRWLLGMAEAGLFPGLTYYLTFWYRHDERSVRVAMIIASATLAGAFGGAIAYGIGHMNQAHGLSGWRWLFILEGIPSSLAAIIIWFCLPDFPETASWLSPEEKELAVRRLEFEGSKHHHKTITWADTKATLMDWRLYGHYAIYFAISIPFASMAFFIPSILVGLGYKDLRAQLMTVPPWVAGYVTQIVVAWSADRFNARAWHIAVFGAIGAAGFIASALLPHDAFLSRYGCLILALSGAFATIPPMLGWLSSNLYTTASVGFAIALNNSLGAGYGQICGLWIYKDNEAKQGYPTGHWTNAAVLLFVSAGAICLRLYYGAENKKALRSGKVGPDGFIRQYKL